MRESEDNTQPVNPDDLRIDLLCGINIAHIRLLCEGGMDGVYGYTPNEVAGFTLDAVFMLLCDKKVLKRDGKRTENIDSLEAVSKLASKDGLIKGRSADGRPIQARVGGESLASRLAREQREAEQKPSRRRRRRG